MGSREPLAEMMSRLCGTSALRYTTNVWRSSLQAMLPVSGLPSRIGLMVGTALVAAVVMRTFQEWPPNWLLADYARVNTVPGRVCWESANGGTSTCGHCWIHGARVVIRYAAGRRTGLSWDPSSRLAVAPMWRR